MNPQEEQLARVEQKIDAMFVSVEKTRKYLLTMLIATIFMVVLPILIGVIALPLMMSTVGSMYGI